MFNIIIDNYQLFLWSIYSYIIIISFRFFFIRKPIIGITYHALLSCILFVAAIAGGGVQNDGYKRLEEFITLEKNNKLDQARKSPQGYDSMLQIDLKQFRTSEDFRDYLKKYDTVADKTEAIFLGWLLALLTEIMLSVTQQLSHIPNRIKNIKIKHKTP